MYESFYRLKEKPFSLLPDPDYLYRSGRHGAALALLEYTLLNRSGFCVISGETGTGKTTLIRYLLARCADNLRVGLISNTHHSFDELLTWIFLAFGLEYQGKTKPELYDGFIQFVIGEYAKSRQTVLVIDEAQNMSPETLEELRMLSNVNAEKDQVLQMILVGQPGLREALRRPGLEQFAQRIAVDYHLGPLGSDETREYIRHRLAVAGGAGEIFDDPACDAVFHYSRGIPRLINLLCDSALVYGYAQHRHTLDADIVRDVIRDRATHNALPRFAPEPQDVPACPAPPDDTRVGKPEEAVASPEAALTPSVSSTKEIMTPGANEEELLQESQVVLHCSTAGGDCVASAVPSPIAGPAEVSPNQSSQIVSKLVRMDAWLRKAPRVGARHSAPAIREMQDSASGAAAGQDGGSVPRSSYNAGIEEHGHADSREAVPIRENAVTDLEGSADVARNDLIADGRERRSRAFWGAAAGMGFVAGLLVAAILIGAVYLRLGSVAQQAPVALPSDMRSSLSGPGSAAPQVGPQPPAAPAPPAAVTGETARSADDIRLKELKRERDAALAEARALEKERDAALAVAKARERATDAELRAVRAEEKEQAAVREASQMQHVQRKEEPAAGQQAEQTAQSVSAVPAAVAAPKTASVATASPAPLSRPARKSRPLTFSANPCKGPSAKFLSTCKE